MALLDTKHDVAHVFKVGNRVPAQDEKAGFATLLQAAQLATGEHCLRGSLRPQREEGEVIKDAKAVQVHCLTHGGIAVVVANQRQSDAMFAQQGSGSL
jgi:hypothetical protein